MQRYLGRMAEDRLLKLAAGPCALITVAAAAGSAWLAERSETSLLPAAAAGIGALASGALVFAVSRRLSPLMALGSALDAAEAGTRDADALRVAERFGPRAKAFNTLIDELNAQRRTELLQRVAESAARPVRRDADLTAACDALWQGLVLIDALGKVRYANGAAAILLGVVRDKLVGAAATDFIKDDRVLAAIGEAARGAGKVKSVAECARAVGGESVLRFSTRTVGSKDQPLAMVLIEDVTQQRIADRSRNAFVAQATHELRTPLTNMRLCLDELLENADLDAPVRAGYLNTLSQESRRLERMVSDMLSISEIEAGTLKLRAGDVRLETLFAYVKADFAAQAQSKRIKLVFNLPPKLPVISGDRDKLMLTIGNLIGNALKYTPEQGEVTVAVRITPAALLVDVIDSGIGVTADEHELIFERFYRSKDQRVEGITGTGLGLALARQVARLHGGDITLVSQLNKGSTFTLTIPAAGPESAASAKAA
ncbi:hypothetical protein BH11PLA1_BH11PLA1_12250 [soil metagenome]